MKTLLSDAEVTVRRMQKNKQVEIIDESTYEDVFEQIESDLEEYRFENQQKIKDSLEEISTIVFTA
ncbi:MAG: hypothetical protein JW870_10235 [Candidatus Delongbacteria bacterium]|nr:hypothetical protein [Candidatus Delongbacteria bacterium]